METKEIDREILAGEIVAFCIDNRIFPSCEFVSKKIEEYTAQEIAKATSWHNHELLWLAFKAGEQWGTTYSTWFTPDEGDDKLQFDAWKAKLKILK